MINLAVCLLFCGLFSRGYVFIKRAMIFLLTTSWFFCKVKYLNVYLFSILPCPLTSPKNVLGQSKCFGVIQNWISFSAAPISFVLAQKLNLLNGNPKVWSWHNIKMHFLVLHKKCGPAQQFLGPVEGQGLSSLDLPVFFFWSHSFCCGFWPWKTPIKWSYKVHGQNKGCHWRM